MRSGFARLHPLVDLTFFVLVLAFAMFLSHPAVQLAGLVCAALFALRCTGRGFGRRMAMLLPLMLLAAVVNPLVSHQGVTVLFRFPSGNACTLESVLYGISAAVRLGTAVLWFMGWNAVMTSDKFVYLFGRILPSLSLTLSMGLRFVPRLLRRTRETADRLGVPAAGAEAGPARRARLAGGHPPRRSRRVHRGHLGTGKCPRHGGLHEEPRLRSAEANGVFPVPLYPVGRHLSRRAGHAGRDRSGREPDRRAEMVVLPRARRRDRCAGCALDGGLRSAGRISPDL